MLVTTELQVEERTLPFSHTPQYRTIHETEISPDKIYTAIIEDKFNMRRSMRLKQNGMDPTARDIHTIMSQTERGSWTRIIYRTIAFPW